MQAMVDTKIVVVVNSVYTNVTVDVYRLETHASF